jgi:glycosyltransferase involved in cell wall biosynthesis
MRRVLMVAYHFPPLAGSSGIQRTLRFIQQLPAFGWQPLVLTAHPRAYERCSPDLDAEVPADCVVRRTFALDTARHLAIAGRYVAAMARPDRWATWKFGAVSEGLRMVREFKPDLIWSTYPIATAHLIGAELAYRSGLPWVADFRDPMAQEGYPADPKTWQQFRAIEQRAMRHARLNVFTTPGAARMYSERYPDAASRITVIENGYDEDSFSGIDAAVHERLNPGAITLLHSGIVYPSERDPTALFVALGRLKRAGKLLRGEVKLRFRAAVHDRLLNDLAAANEVQELVEVLPPIPYRAALQEILHADALVVMQGSGCNEQIPAKVYEYLRSGRPILGLTDPRGDTAAVLRDAGINAIANLASTDDIERQLPAFVDAVRLGRAELPTLAAIQEASRRARTQALAGHMEAVLQKHP